MNWSPSAPAWVWKLGINPGAWRVLIGLWSFADHDAEGETVVYPGRAALADRLGLTERTLRTQLNWLLDAGWVKREPGYKGYQLAMRLAWESAFTATTQPIRENDATDPVPDTQPIRESDATDPLNRIGCVPKDTQPIRHTSQPHNLTILPPSAEPEQATFALTPIDARPTRADRVGELRAAHERLAIAAHSHHGHKPRGTSVRGALPKYGTKPSNAIERRISEALAAYGFDACMEVIEWRAAEWRDDKRQLARPPEQAWSENAVKYVLRKIDEGVDHRDRGKHSSGGMIRHPMTVISRGGDEFQ